MDIYSIFMFIAILTYAFTVHIAASEVKKQKYKKQYCILMGIFLFLIAALRSTSVGIDSEAYSYLFYQVKGRSWERLYYYYPKETWFYIFMKLLTIISSDHQILFAVTGIIFAYAISHFIYRYSKNCMLSFVMLIPMMYFSFTLTGLRQTIALSIMLLSIDLIVKRKVLYFILSVWIASNFHQSAFLFLPAYFLTSKKVTDVRIIVYALAAPIVFVFRGQIASIIQRFLYSSYSIEIEYQNTGGWTTLFIYFLIVFVSTIFKSISNREDKNFPFFYSMMFVGMCVQMFVPLQPNIFRVSMYYNIASIILIPLIISAQKEAIIRIFVYVLFFVLMGIQYYVFTFNAAGINPYRFFWQN